MKDAIELAASLILIAVLLMITVGIVGAGICFWVDLISLIA